MGARLFLARNFAPVRSFALGLGAWSTAHATALTRAVGLLFLLNGAFIAYVVLGHLNYLQMDLGGHAASAGAFREGLFHQFNDSFFLGYIHDLFYPPLEDAAVAGLSFLTGDIVTAYKAFLVLVACGWLGAGYALAFRIQRIFPRLFFLFIFLFLLNIEKAELLEYQGLSFVDLWLTGLSSELLGGIFFFWFLRELLGPTPRTAPLAVLLALTLLSHLVVGVVAALVALVFLPSPALRKRLAVAMLFAVGLAAFFVIPFAVHRGYLTASMIYRMKPVLFAGVTLVGLVLALRLSRARGLFAAALILFAPLLLGPTFEAWGLPVPKFHYYRFGILALLLAALGFAAALDDTRSPRRLVRAGLIVTALVFAGALAVHFRLQRFDFSWPALQAPKVDFRAAGPLAPAAYGRYFVVGNERTSAFGLESLLSLKAKGFRSNKGLFWESSRNNPLLASYLATLLGPPVVLDYFYFYGYGCEVNECLVDHFLRDYNVKGLIIDTRLPMGYLKDDRKACYRLLLDRGGTTRFALTPTGKLQVDHALFTVFDATPRGRVAHAPAGLPAAASRQAEDPAALSNDAVELLPPSALASATGERQSLYGETIRDVYEHCQRGETSQRILFPAPELARLQQALGPALARLSFPGATRARATFEKLGTGRFAIEVAGSAPALFRIKLAYLPGVTLHGAGGEELPLFDGMPHMVGFGQGRMTLEYRRTAAMWTGYGISLFTALLGGALWWRARRRSAKRPRSGADPDGPPTHPADTTALPPPTLPAALRQTDLVSYYRHCLAYLFRPGVTFGLAGGLIALALTLQAELLPKPLTFFPSSDELVLEHKLLLISFGCSSKSRRLYGTKVSLGRRGRDGLMV